MLYLDLVGRFHAQFSYRFPTPIVPSLDADCCALRVSLLREELTGKGELWDSITNGDRHGILDGLCDFQYVLSGAVLALGLRELLERALPLTEHNATVINSPDLISQLRVNQIAVAIDRLEYMLKARQVPASVECLARIQLLLDSLIKSLGFERTFEAAFIATHENNMSKRWTEEQVVDWLNANKDTPKEKWHKFEQSGGYFIARRYDGKIAKPANHRPVDLSEFITI